jgi:hypothetical protein
VTDHIFTDGELAYLDSQRLGRLATLQANGAVQNNPVGFYYNAARQTIDIGGRDMANSQKFKNVARKPTGVRRRRHRIDRSVAGSVPRDPRPSRGDRRPDGLRRAVSERDHPPAPQPHHQLRHRPAAVQPAADATSPDQLSALCRDAIVAADMPVLTRRRVRASSQQRHRAALLL